MSPTAIAAMVAGVVAFATLIYALVLQSSLWKARLAQQKIRLALDAAGVRIAELSADLESERERGAEQLARMEAEIVELESYLETCDVRTADRVRLYHGLQSVRTALRDHAPAEAEPGVSDRAPAGPDGGRSASEQSDV